MPSDSDIPKWKGGGGSYLYQLVEEAGPLPNPVRKLQVQLYRPITVIHISSDYSYTYITDEIIVVRTLRGHHQKQVTVDMCVQTEIVPSFNGKRRHSVNFTLWKTHIPFWQERG